MVLFPTLIQIFNSQAQLSQRWVTILEGTVTGWCNLIISKAWKSISPLSAESARLGYLPLLDLIGQARQTPWWQSLAELNPEVDRRLIWSSLPQATSTPLLCEEGPWETL
ncbi:hypothetical protein CMV_002932 [Castanea mollissima]|uniref:Uncharacterized protein n=1 Tax=Castanea mollissima TaxID=60419 RepID=A0A8J4VVP1_9ROSI|nr:hypothetical protein CMV_002932 [Castanea mollissima]